MIPNAPRSARTRTRGEWRGKAQLGAERASPNHDRNSPVTQTDALAPPSPGRFALPAWLVRMLRPAPLPVDGTRIVAAMLGIAGPQALAYATGHRDVLALVSTGALCASFSDLTTSYRYRMRRLGLTAVLGAAGFAAGAATSAPWQVIAVVVAVGVLSVLCSRMGDLWAAAGAQMITFCIVATGHGVPARMPLGEIVLWFAAGELLLLALAASTWPFRRTAPARAAVARVFEAALSMFEDPQSPVAARQELTRALNNAHDLLATGGSVARSRVHDRLHLVLSHTTPVVEASVALAHAGVRPPEASLQRLRSIADGVRSGALAPPPTPAESGDEEVRALDDALIDLVDSWRDAQLRSPRMAQQQLGARERFRLWRANTAFGWDGWRAALRLAACLVLAESLTLALGLQQPYWVAMTVALALKPNSGSVFARVTMRAVGTVLGVLLAAGVLSLSPHGWPTVLFLLVMAAALPEALSRHYGLFTAAVTSVVLMLVSQTHLFPQQIPAERLVNSLLGCAIALVVGHLLRPERGPALPRRIAGAVETVSEYLQLSLPGPAGSASTAADERSPLRRRAYRELSDLRAALQQQLLEPGSTRTAEQWWTSVILLERVLDAATERAVLVGQRADDQLQDAQRAVSEMRTTARRLRGSAHVEPADLRRRLDDVYGRISG